MGLKLEDLDYNLPPERIARFPVEPRDASRLMVLDRASGARRHLHFRDLPDLLSPGDVLVVNDTRVLPARFVVRRATGGRLEGLFIREFNDTWWVMLKGAGRVDAGERLAFEGGGHTLELLERVDETTWAVRCDPPDLPSDVLARHGRVPLPPYIVAARRQDARDRTEATVGPGEGDADPPAPCDDAACYQTVYARREGAVAAPTAGLHFTEELIRRVYRAGASIVGLTLHVGPGTFAPVTAADLDDHRMPAEEFHVLGGVVEAVAKARAAKKKVIAVGTTVVRALESCADLQGNLRAGWGNTRLFIKPGYRFKVVDRLITNFHLPRSTLLALVFAFAGRERTLEAYREAVTMGYRFYSYGDAMLVT